MTDTVIILGAGYSYAAGIPLLSGFVERMWQFAVRKSVDGRQLTAEDMEIFGAAIKIREELDGYHGRAMFDDRNIEDILSILSFNMLGGSRRDRDKIASMNQAIARTIELSCSVEHPGVPIRGLQQRTSQVRNYIGIFGGIFLLLYQTERDFLQLLRLTMIWFLRGRCINT